MDNKGGYSLSKEWGLWAIRISVVIVFLIFLYFMVSFSISNKENLEGFSPMILKQRLLYSPECFVYTDGEGNAQPGVFDMEKVSQKRLLSCLSTVKEGIMIQISAAGKMNTFEVNPQVLSDKSLCQFKKTMSCSRDVAYVLIRDKEKLMPAYMIMQVMDYK